MCLYTDASETHGESILTQVPSGQLSEDDETQTHEPLVFISGSFDGHSMRWSVVEKEYFAVLESIAPYRN